MKHHISAISPVPKKATTAVAQTLTCIIGDVDTVVDVSWKDKDESLITNEQAGYTINPGTVTDTNIQEATLTISPDILGDLGSPVNYTCAAKSVQYPESAVSADRNVVMTLFKFGETNIAICLLKHCT